MLLQCQFLNNMFIKFMSIGKYIDCTMPLAHVPCFMCRPGSLMICSKWPSQMFLSILGKKTKQLRHKKLVAAGVEYICGFFLGDDKLWGAGCGKGVVRVQINIAKS